MTDSPRLRFDEDLAGFPTFQVEGESVRLLGSRCRECRVVAFPRRSVCLECDGEHESAILSGEGVLHSWTLIAKPPAGFDEPFPYGCIDLAEGPRLLAALRGTPAIGRRVRAVLDSVQDGTEGFRFEVFDA